MNKQNEELKQDDAALKVSANETDGAMSQEALSDAAGGQTLAEIGQEIIDRMWGRNSDSM